MDLNLIESIGKGKQETTQHKQVRQPEPSYIIDGADQKLEMYNPKDAIKRMNENIRSGKAMGGSKMPSAIRESLLSNPLIMPTTDDDMSKFTDQLGEKLAGIQKSMGILEQSERYDKKDRTDTALPSVAVKETKTGAVDYELIKMIVENAVEAKMAALSKTMLNESASRNGNKLSVMSIGDKFLFLDGDDNIYECTMTFKGKNKKKRKT